MIPLIESATSYTLVHSSLMLHLHRWFHSAGLLHHSLWFTRPSCYISKRGSTLPNCYIVFYGSLLPYATSYTLAISRPMIHEVCLWILASLSHSLCQSQFLMPAKTYNLIRLCLGTAYTLVSIATSFNGVHSTPLLHQAKWFTLIRCYIICHGSLVGRATS